MQNIEDLTRELIRLLGEEPSREGLVDTPGRVARSWRELTDGYSQDPEKILGTVFDSDGYNQMILVKDIPFFSLCEHHLLPFYGTATVGYIPYRKVVGLSKIPRLVNVYSRRLQIQERLTEQIATCIFDTLKPLGVGVTISAHHMCMMMRGVRTASEMVTSSLKGIFLEKDSVRMEFLNLSR